MSSKERATLDAYIKEKGLRRTPQRETVLEVFLSAEHHITLDELYKRVRRKDASIGHTTVYRTMRLLIDAGLCNEMDFGDGISRYEHAYEHGHHDHLICTRCGSCIEAGDPEIEKLQEKLATRFGFRPERHKLQIYGRCKECAKRR
jgi:Fur family ferric uptake transcriptional regulator